MRTSQGLGVLKRNRRRSILVSILFLAGGLSFVGCEGQVLEPDSAQAPDTPLLKKDGGGKPGGGGGSDPGPTEITILFDDHINRNLGVSLYGMDRTGAITRVLKDSDEVGFASAGPRWAPDGIRFVYEREPSSTGGSEVVIGDVGGTITPIFVGSWGMMPNWSTLALDDGHERIAFVRNGDLHLMRTDGTDIVPITAGLDVEAITWSRDATKVIAAIRDEEYDPDRSHLEIFDVVCDGSCRSTGSTALDLSSSGVPDGFYGSLDWAHGSDRVLIHYLGAGRVRELAILDLSGTPTFSLLTDNPGGQAYNGAWSWDDSEIVYVKFPIGKKPKAGIMIRNVATGAEHQVYDGDAMWGMDWRPTPPTGQ